MKIKKIPKTWKNFYGFSVPRKSEIFAVSLSPQQAAGVFTAKFFAFSDRYFQSFKICRSKLRGIDPDLEINQILLILK